MFREHMPITDRRVSTSLTRDRPSSHASIWDSQRPAPPSKRAGYFAHIKYTIAELCWLIRMGFILLLNLGLVGKWVIMAIRLGLFAVFLAPAWCIVGYTYFTSKFIKRGVRYGKFNRNFADLYLPSNVVQYKGRKPNQPVEYIDLNNSDTHINVPVVLFISGGAWTIGYKAWGALLGIELQRHGILVVCADYRNYPQGKIGDMIDDTSNALSWVTQNIHKYGGDCNNIYLVGQSAGGHISALTCMMKARREREQLLKDLDKIQNTVTNNQFNNHNHIHSQDGNKHTLHKINESTIHNGIRYRSNTTVLDGSNTVHVDNNSGHIHTANSDLDLDIDVNNDADISNNDDDNNNHNNVAVYDFPAIVSGSTRQQSRLIQKLKNHETSEPRDLIDVSVSSPVKHRQKSSSNHYNYNIDQHTHNHYDNTTGSHKNPKSRQLIRIGAVECSCCTPNLRQRVRSASLSAEQQQQAHNTLTTPKHRVSVQQTKWRLSQIRSFIGVSGVYNLVEAEQHMACKGLPCYVLRSIMGSNEGEAHELHTVDDGYYHTLAPLYSWSPTLLAHEQWFKSVVALFPPVLLLHGTADTSSHWTASEQYGRALAHSGCKVAVKYYKDATHTDPIIEGPMAGHDHLLFDILAVIHKIQQHQQRKHEKLLNHVSSYGKQINTDTDNNNNYSNSHNNNNDEISDFESDSDNDDIVPPPSVAGYLPTHTDTSDQIDPVPDFELGLDDNITISKLYKITDPKPIIPRILINAARYVNPF